MKTTLTILCSFAFAWPSYAIVCLSPEEAREAGLEIIDARAGGRISDEEYEARLRSVMPEECFGQWILDPECDENCIHAERVE